MLYNLFWINGIPWWNMKQKHQPLIILNLISDNKIFFLVAMFVIMDICF